MERQETLQDAVEETANGTAFNLSGMRHLALQISGTFVATVTFEGSVDGTNWINIVGTNKNDGSQDATATAAGIFIFDIPGLALFRARISAYTSGAVTATATGTSQ